MTVLPTTICGSGCPVLLVHGVGVGSASYRPLVRALSEDACVIVPDRRGYGRAAGMPLAQTCQEHVDDLLETVADLGAETAVWLGVSGGATLGLLACARAPDRIRSAVLHEPLLGPIVSRLHAQIIERRDALRADPSATAAVGFVRGLLGERSWALIGAAGHAAINDVATVVRCEVEMFAEVGFETHELAAMRGRSRIVSSVGSESPPVRDETARVLAAQAGAEIEVLRGGHLAPIESPEATAELVWRSLRPAEPRTEAG